VQESAGFHLFEKMLIGGKILLAARYEFFKNWHTTCLVAEWCRAAPALETKGRRVLMHKPNN
jgi:hypothetical protein